MAKLQVTTPIENLSSFIIFRNLKVRARRRHITFLSGQDVFRRAFRFNGVLLLSNRDVSPGMKKACSSSRAIIRAIVADDGVDSMTTPSRESYFNFETAVLAASLSFESYSEPVNSRWERGSKGCDVAFKSPSFTSDVYKGLIELTVLEAAEVAGDSSAQEKLLTGTGADLYAMAAMVEEDAAEDTQAVEGFINEGVVGLERCSNIIRTSTVWANNKESDETGNKFDPKCGTHAWGGRESHYLYVREPDGARLALTLMDENKVSDDEMLGACTVRLKDLLGPLGDVTSESSERKWEGWMNLTSKPAKTDKQGQIAMGATAGGMLFGPMGAAAGGFAASMWEGSAKGKVKLRMRYIPLSKDSGKSQTKEKRQSACASEGVDWEELGKKVGGVAATQSDYELCAFVSHQDTGCTAGLYRSRLHKRLVVAFRGTCSPVDLITDASLLQTPWVDTELEGEMQVHAGFRTSLQSITRRLKELTIAAAECEGGVGEWDLMVTGHSLGGALATLWAADIAEFGLDSGRGLPMMQKSEPWWSRLRGGKKGRGSEAQVPRPRKIQLYTFGSPRVGNEAFAAHFETLGIDEVYRVVNGADVVARVPRNMNAMFASVNYSHCGRTALVTAAPEELAREVLDVVEGEVNAIASTSTAALWVEGESDMSTCPVRDASPLTNPFGKGAFLGEVASKLSEVDLRGGWDFANKISEAADSIGGLLEGMSPAEAASVIGIDAQFVTRELDLLKSIQNGMAVTHHLEPAYFSAMCHAAQAVSDDPTVFLPQKMRQLEVADEAVDPRRADVFKKLDMLEVTLVSEQQKKAFEELTLSLQAYTAPNATEEQTIA